MKTWIKGSLIGLSFGLLLGILYILNDSFQIFYIVRRLTESMNIFFNLFISLTQRTNITFVESESIFYTLALSLEGLILGAIVGYIIEKNKSGASK
jgi:uncharacterized membrane protein